MSLFKKFPRFSRFTFLFFLICSFQAYAGLDYNDYVQIEILNGEYQNKQAVLGVQFQLKPGWKIYNDEQHDLGFPTTVKLISNNNIQNFEVFYPQATKFIEAEEFITYGYQDTVILPLIITPEITEQEIQGEFLINFALCEKICIPVEHKINAAINYGEISTQNLELIHSYVSDSSTRHTPLILILFLAFIAGVILNFMPCVLPVLTLKVFNFLEKRKEAKKEIVIASLFTISGIFVSFMAFAAFVISLKFTGKNIGWGMHFQEPIFIAFLIVLLMIFAASVFEYFTINVPNKWLNRISHLEHVNNGRLKHFFSGILATILATPCSAPFLGGAITFALTSNYLNIILVFSFIAIGLAFPYILLIIAPRLLFLLPKPGRWMVSLKKLLGILLIATATWLLWVIKRQVGLDIAIIFTIAITILFLSFKFKNELISFIGKRFFILLIIANITLSFILICNARRDITAHAMSNIWQDYHAVNIEKLIAEDKVIFVNITADWCLTCKFNEIFVLNDSKVQTLFADPQIVAVKADYTIQNKEIYNLLRSVDRYAIPTYIIYSKNNKNGKLLGELLTSKVIIDNIQEESNLVN